MQIGYVDIAVFLINHGINIGDDENKTSPYLLSLEGDFSDIIELLYSMGKTPPIDEIYNSALILNKPNIAAKAKEIKKEEKKKTVTVSNLPKKISDASRLSTHNESNDNPSSSTITTITPTLVKFWTFKQKRIDTTSTLDISFLKGAITWQDVKNNLVRRHSAYFYYVDKTILYTKNEQSNDPIVQSESQNNKILKNIHYYVVIPLLFVPSGLHAHKNITGINKIIHLSPPNKTIYPQIK